MAQQTDPVHGLSGAEVEDRIARGRTNAPVDPPSKTVREIVAGNIFTYFNLVFTVIAVLLILVGSFRDLTFYGIIIANTLIGILQELRSKMCIRDSSYSYQTTRKTLAGTQVPKIKTLVVLRPSATLLGAYSKNMYMKF